MTFKELGVAESILRAIDELGFVAPMPVQEAVIPYLLGTGNDVIALAQTGTGKTAAYGIPLLQKIDTSRNDVQAIVICPTRELCLQIAGDMKDFSKYIDNLAVVPVYGGANIESQIRALRRGAHIIIATPGRLIDLMERGVAHLNNVENVVLDEADEMLNMGFSESIDTILEGVPQNRNTLLFSATMSQEISKIAQHYLHHAKEIVIGSRNEGAELVNHEYYLVHAKDKYLALKRVVDYYPRIYAIIFCRTRLETQEIADKLIQDGYNAESLHGDLSQAQRDLTMQRFRQHHIQLLVATDVAARGLDVDDLTHVINYGLPDDVENYTHRSGRTGRAGKKGTSICIVHLMERNKIRAIEKTIGKSFVQKTLPTPTEICTRQLYKIVDQLERAQVDEEQIAPFLPEVFRRLDWLDKEDIIKRMVSLEFDRFLNYYANAPEIEEPKTSHRETKSSRKKGGHDTQAEEGYVRFFFGAGKRDHFYAKEIIGLINRYTFEPVEIGKIDLKMNFSFFEVPEKDADIVEAALKKAKDRNGKRIVIERTDETGKNASGTGKKERKNREKGKSRKAVAKKESAKTESPKKSRKKGKEDWMKFFDHSNDNFQLRGEKPDFTEEGWVKPKKKSRK